MFTPELKLEHADARGEIYSITLPGDRELLLIHSKEGALRGGHAHDVDEAVVMLTGKMLYHKRAGSGELTGVLKGGGYSFNPKGMAHLGEFLEDSWLIEAKSAPIGAWRNIDDPEWRAKVKLNSVS